MTIDPRPDLATDHPLWERLLVVSHVAPYDLYWSLKGLRCLGAALVARSAGGVRLVAGELTEGEYQDAKARYLVPYGERLLGLLEGIG